MIKEIIIGIIVILVTGVIALQFRSFKDWLLYAVMESEEYFGSGTGKLKLMYVYNLAISKYPLIARIITFDMFSKFVDLALDRMKEIIEENDKIADIITNKKILF